MEPARAAASREDLGPGADERHLAAKSHHFRKEGGKRPGAGPALLMLVRLG